MGQNVVEMWVRLLPLLLRERYVEYTLFEWRVSGTVTCGERPVTRLVSSHT